MVWFGNRNTGPTETVIDTFDDDSYPTNYVGGTSTFAENTTLDALERTGSTGPANTVSTSGLPAYVSKGQELRSGIDTNQSSPSGSNLAVSVLWGAADIDNYYMCQVNWDTENVRIWINDGGSLSTIDGGSTAWGESVSASDQFVVRVEWDDGSTFGGSNNDMNWYLEYIDGTEITSGTVNDSTHATASGIGARSASAVSSYESRWREFVQVDHS